MALRIQLLRLFLDLGGLEPIMVERLQVTQLALNFPRISWDSW